MSARKVHARSIRAFNNAGMDFPLCYWVRKGLLDTDKGRLPTSNDLKEVTCKHCLRLKAHPDYRWS